MNYNISKQDMMSIAKKAYGYFKKASITKINNFIELSNITFDDFIKDEYINEYIKKSLEVVKNYINSSDTLDVFQSKQDFRKEHLEKYIDVVRLIYPDIYYMFLKKKNYEEKLIIDIVDRTKDELCELIVDGIEENGEVRKFDIIDYYEVANIPPSSYLNALKNNNRENVAYIKALSTDLNNFAEKEFSDKDRHDFIENLYMLKGKTFDKNEKIEIVNYLEDNNIPFNTYSRLAAAHRLIKGTLYTKNKEKIKRV